MSSTTTNNRNNNGTDNTTTTPLIFNAATSPHRKMLSVLLSGLESDVAQTILDELAGALESVKRGTRQKPIGSVRAWVSELVNLAATGDFVPELTPMIRAKREQAELTSEPVTTPTAREIGRKNMDAVRAALRRE